MAIGLIIIGVMDKKEVKERIQTIKRLVDGFIIMKLLRNGERAIIEMV